MDYDELHRPFEQRENAPRWQRAAREIRRRLYLTNIRHDGSRIRLMLQRAKYGIGTGDAADLHVYLSEVAVRGLRQLRAWSNSCPNDRAPEDWSAEIVKAADAIEAWLAVGAEPARGSNTAERDAFSRRQAVVLARAKDAWHWIGDNIDDLWD